MDMFHSPQKINQIHIYVDARTNAHSIPMLKSTYLLALVSHINWASTYIRPLVYNAMLCFQVIIFAIKKIQKSKKWVPSTKIHIHKYKTTSNTCNMYENVNKLCIVLIYVTSKCT